MLRRLLILNLGLLVLIALAALKLQQDWNTFVQTHDVDSVQPGPVDPIAVENLAVVRSEAPGDWIQVAELNPFSFDRNDVPTILPPEEVRVTTAPAPLLMGTMMLGNDDVALIAAGRGERYRPVRLGETVDGWELVEIRSKSVVMSANGQLETVLLNDPTAQTERQGARTVAPNRNPNPTVVTVAPAANGPAAAAEAPAGAATTGTTTRTRVVQTPFGPRVVQEPQ